jgi:D-alanine-D-alanine ligase
MTTALALLRSSPHLRAGAVVEPFRAGAADLNVAVRTWPELQLSAIERPVRHAGSGDILGYRDKYMGGEGMVSAPRELPADVAPEVAEQIRETATAVARLTRLRGVARIDFLDAEGELYVNEVNTIPGSLSKYLWVEPEVPFTRLLDDLLGEAEQRPAFHYSTAGADGTALRSAGNIADKLA